MKITVTHDDGTTVDITTGVQVAYDIAYGSMDWGSDFLDAEEMGAVADLAEACQFPSFEAARASVHRRKEEQERQAKRDHDRKVEEARRRAVAEQVRQSWQDQPHIKINADGTATNLNNGMVFRL